MAADDIFEVLLSTFNGRRFLLAQLHSIESQTVEGVRLRVRDDGSTDGTTRLLEQYASEREWITLTCGGNLGAAGSFLRLLQDVGDDVNWVAFCDQDDVWDQDKLQRAKDALGGVAREVPAMYFSGARLVDETGIVIGTLPLYERQPRFLNGLCQNVATGCTIVLNRAAIDLFAKRNVDVTKIGIHDWWVYLVVTAFGEAVYDPTPSLDYRQHSANVIGSSSGIARWVNRLTRFRRQSRTALLDRARELMRVYADDLSKEHLQITKEFVNGAGASSLAMRFRYALSAPIYRQGKLDDILMRILIALGWR
jgi:glycosyltransferase involved in cell wall biosynthesis